jgi:PAS domain S-box-containing protein
VSIRDQPENGCRTGLPTPVGKPPVATLANRAMRFVGSCHAQPLAWRLSLALAAVLLAVVVRVVFLDALGGRLVYLTFYPAVAVAALLGGLAGGVSAMIASAVLGHVLIAPLTSGADMVGLAAFLVSSFIVAAMAEAVRVSQTQQAGIDQIRLSEQQIHSFVERVPAAIAMFDTGMRYLAASARWRQDFGIEGDVTGRLHYDVLPEIPERWKDTHRRGLAGQGSRADEDCFTRADGTSQWLNWEVQPWYRAGNSIGGITIFCEDITGKKRIEEQLALAQKMEVVGNLSGGVAHDFNNLLTIIMGNAELLGEQLRARRDLSQIADHIIQAAEHGAELTRRLLAFGRRQMLRPVELDCNELLDGLHQLLGRTMRGNIELRTRFDPGLPLAFADSSQLESAVLHLAINAQDAMPEGGRLTITTSVASLDRRDQELHPDVAPGDYVSIAVADNGEGIPKDIIARVFEPFFTTKEVGKGSGLGLSMVYGFAKQSGGHVSIDSEPGLGTTVRIYLPLAPASAVVAREQSRAEEPVLPQVDETVLVVEDDPLVRSYVVMSLESLGYRTVAAVDVNEALRTLNGDIRVDLLFSDIVMPGGIDGWKLADLAQHARPGLPVLLTSGHALETLIEQGSYRAGLLVLAKPYRKTDLAHRLRQALAATVSLAQ